MSLSSDARLGDIWALATSLARGSQPEGLNSLSALAHSRLWRAAVSEAVSLLGLEARGCMVAPTRIKACNQNCRDISDVLTIPAAERTALRAFVDANPDEHEMVVGAVVFRQMVCSAVEALRAQEVVEMVS